MIIYDLSILNGKTIEFVTEGHCSLSIRFTDGSLLFLSSYEDISGDLSPTSLDDAAKLREQRQKAEEAGRKQNGTS